jgi:4-hydroxy-3-polyprenylbenzoate decarboxylase
VLVVRETPFHRGHLSLMMNVADAGGVILPPIPAFYFLPKTIDDLINHLVGRVLDIFEIDHHLFNRWGSRKLKNALRKKGTSH